MTPNFSAYPWDRVQRLGGREAAMQSTIARWIGAHQRGVRLETLLGVPVSTRVGSPSAKFDPYAASCHVRVRGATIVVRGAGGGVRAIAQRMLGGAPELAAPRPLTIVEQSMWCLVVATALEDLAVAGEVWLDPAASSSMTASAAAPVPASARVGLDVRAGDIAITAEIEFPAQLELRVPPRQPGRAWLERVVLDIPVVVGRCALRAEDVERLAPRSLVTLERPAHDASGVAPVRPGEIFAGLEIFGGYVGLRGALGAMVAEVATGYVARDMALPDDAQVELTVALGTTALSLRQVTELAIGQIVSLGRPLAGPFEVRAQGRVLGRGELVDVDGELAVRIVSLGD